jgi:hypothetical protein
MAPLTAVGADWPIVMSSVAAFSDVTPLMLSVTLNWNEPAVVLSVVGTKVRSPALIWAAVITSEAVMATPLSSSVPSLGSEVMVMLASVSAATTHRRSRNPPP